MATATAETPVTITREVRLATEDVVPSFDAKTLRRVFDVTLMDGAELPERLSMIDTHQKDSVRNVFGSFTNLRIRNGELWATAVFATDPESMAIGQRVADDHIRSVSISIKPITTVRVPAGTTQVVRGKTITAPEHANVFVYERWRPTEGSLAIEGADPRAKFRSTNGEPQNEQPTRVLREATFSDGRVRSAESSNPKGSEMFATAPAIQTSKTATHQHRDTVRSVAHGVAQSCGFDLCDTLPDDADDTTRKREERYRDSGEYFAGEKLIGKCRHALRAAGLEVPPSPWDIIVRTFSGGDTDVFTPTIGASVLAGYREAVDITPDWTTELESKTYAQHEVHVPSAVETLAVRPRGDAAAHASRDSHVEFHRTYNFARQFATDGQDIIDDDPGFLTVTPRMIGNAAGRVRPDLVFSLLLENPVLNQDSVAMFDASHSNLAAVDFTTANYHTGRLAIRNQSSNGISPQYAVTDVIAPGDGESTIRQQLLNEANSLSELGVTLRLEDRLGTGGVVDPVDGTLRTGTATTWLLAAASAPNVGVSYLNGRREPRVTMWTNELGSWGVGWSVDLSVGVCPLDFKGMYYSTGS